MPDPTPTLAPECMEKPTVQVSVEYVACFERMRTRLESCADHCNICGAGPDDDDDFDDMAPCPACVQIRTLLDHAADLSLAPALAASVAMGKQTQENGR